MQQQGWEAYAGKLGTDLMQKAQDRLAWLCEQVQGDHILEADCGQAAALILLARDGKTVVGLCSDPVVYKQARAFIGQEPAQVQRAVTLHEGNLDEVPSLIDRSFDTIILTESIAQASKPRELIELAYRKLKPEGRLITLWPLGVQDTIRARHTFFVREPARHLGRHFETQETRVFGDAIAFVSKARKKVLARTPATTTWPDALVKDLEAALKDAEQAAVDKLHAAHEQLLAMQAQYDDATERLAALDSLQAEHESQATTLRAQLEAVQHAQKDAEAAAQQEIAELKAELQTRQSAADQAAQAVAQVQAQSRILELEQVQQIAVLRHEKLERDLRIQELERRAADAQRDARDAENARDAAKQSLLAGEVAAKVQREQFESRIRDLEARARELEAQAAEALRDAQTAREEAAQQLHASETATHTQRTQFEQRIQELRVSLDSRLAEYAALRAQYEQDQQQAAQRLASLEADKVQSEKQLAMLQTEMAALRTEVTGLRTAREQLAGQHRQAELSLKTLNAQLLQVRTQNEQTQTRAAAQAKELQDKLARAEQELSTVTTELKNAQLKHREILAKYRDGQERGKEADEKIRHLERRLRNLQHEKEQALHQVEQTRNTQSFQLGYALLHGFKSWSAFSKLPSDLMRIRREAKARRARKQRKLAAQGEPSSASAPSKFIRAPQPPTMLVSQSAVTIGAQQAKTRIAAIMDEFTFHSYAPECELLQLRPESWQQEIEAFKPDLVFIESAWKGVEDLWARKVSNCTEEVRALLQWAKANQVPSMFWNKEDPVHFSTFIELASLVDHVFTTDIDCIPKYKKVLGHNRVYLLPFAAQPATHNPIEIYDRKDAFNFAGSYYLRYPERQRDFAALIDTVQQFRPVEIYDRNYEKPHPHYQFPEKYSRYILGTLKFDEIDRAYKGYRYGINMNTIKQSQTMFARRVFELLASNTVVVSNFSRGMRLLFGDLVISSDNAEQIDARVRTLCSDEVGYRKFRLAGLRKVMAEHTYKHRLGYIKAKLSGTPYTTEIPGIGFVATANTQAELEALKSALARQSHLGCRLFVLTKLPVTDVADTSRISYHASAESLMTSIRDHADRLELLGVLHPQDYYGEHYAEDLAWAATYCSTAEAYGKAAYYQYEAARCSLHNDGQQYRFTKDLSLRASAVRITTVNDQELSAWLGSIDDATTAQRTTLALDEFNYLANGISAPDETIASVRDMAFALGGVSFMRDLAPLAESMAPAATLNNDSDDDLPSISATDLAKAIVPPASKAISLKLTGDTLRITSRLPAEKHAYMYVRTPYRREDINMVLNSQFQLVCDDPGEVRTVFEFQDKDGKKISHSMMGASGTHALAIPNECVYIRFGLRVLGAADIKIHRLVLGTHGEKPAVVAGRSPVLVLTKQYPAYDDLYRYGFLHTRIRAYVREGYPVEIFRITNQPSHPYREFENIDVASGDAALLRDTLKSGRYKHVLVHILDTNMWNVLKDFLDTVKVTVWAHGSEIQLWQRRAYEFVDMTPEEIARKKKLSDSRKSFWRTVLTHPSENLSFVFVSNWLKTTTEQDIGITLPDGKFQVIHNFVDGKIFDYQEKSADGRKKILSIRPYANRTYANDLTVQTILELSKKPYFSELAIELCGDGELFDETTRPLEGFGNVKLSKGFLTHTQIAAKHKHYGVFMTPSRMDTQGVSRDEAMSSGLVPVTTTVAAIPEFVSEKEGQLCPPEDAVALASAIDDLIHSPGKFLEKSAAAHRRVRASLGIEQTIAKELSIFQ